MTANSYDNALTPDELRRRLVEIDDELRSLPADAFAEKHKLNVEGDLVRSQLPNTTDDPTASAWAERAGRKGSHTVDDEVEAAKAAIVSSGGGDGGAWSSS